MKIALIFKEDSKEYTEIPKILGDSCTVFKDILDFDKNKENYDCVYSPDPKELLKIQNKIPYFYDISAKTVIGEMDYASFFKFYSQISGSLATFTSDKKLNKNACWMNLNSYWVNKSADTDIIFKFKKFVTPKLNVGYIFQDPESFEIIKKVIYAKKDSWLFHVYYPFEIDDSLKNKGVFFYSGDLSKAKEDILSKVHVNIDFDLNLSNMSDTFPSEIGKDTLLSGTILISSNPQGNNTHILFDKFNYFKLDFIDANTILDTLRYIDKRREKLEVMAKAGAEVVKKYFDYKRIAQQKVDIIKSLL